jgi:hypothetical protein
MDDLCRNHLHPLEGNRGRNKSRRGTYCIPCNQTVKARQAQSKPPRDGWCDPIAAVEWRQWLQAWQDGIDATIARIRAAEGFDGEQQLWQTLGEYLRPDASLREQMAPAPIRVSHARRPDHCVRCGAFRRIDAPCGFCADVLGIGRAS